MKRRLFDEVLGHMEARKRLHHLVVSKRLTHLNLFVGPEGVGKKRIAMALAQVLVCETSDKACGECGSCLRLANEQSEALLVIKPDGQQIKVEQAREIAEFCSLQASSKARIVVVDQAERLNPQASNSLLKLFEEPPPNTYFFLMAPSPQSVLPTVRSRAQITRFGVLQKSDLAKKNFDVPGWVLESAGGRLDRIETLQSEELLELRTLAASLLNQAMIRDFDQVMETLKEGASTRENALWIVKFWREFVRDLWVGSTGADNLIHPDLYERLSSDFASLGHEHYAVLSDRLQKLEQGLLSNYDTQLNMELFLREASL